VYSEADYHEENEQSHPALKLSNFFREHCGVDCEVDLHHSTELINNWNQWMEQKIKRCRYIILLCGENLHKSLQEVNNERIKMHNAHIGVQTLNNLIDDRETNTYFIPVFIGKELVNCIPTALKDRSCYTVQYDAVMKDYDDVKAVLGKEENKSLYSLVAKLTEQQEYDKPPVYSYDGTSNSSKSC